ncbi:terminase [Allonocardiopsis opalescens]|uniref:Phage terminase large subunit-like protein n=1 Tax=Allonocardiopsis opalescens TaxID=1144618 RepID=A0A2T0PVM6_9ACTN|nr:terminase [Allonocardiopsis opalescens]PRX95582.1 phage terminase large subunit-like protein [Allonocardiopsis opalescens]
MPRTLVRSPAHDRLRSLGWLALAWMEYFVVHGPGDVQGQPVRHGDEYSGFVADCYALDEHGRLLYDSAFFSRPKGADKSGLGARLSLFEALGPCRFAGFADGGEVYTDPWGAGFTYVYEPGEPMGRPVQTPYIRIMATEEGQTGNVYDSVHFNLDPDEGTPLSGVCSRHEVGLTRILLPGGGEITPSTASSASKDGGKETFVVFDESHLYNTPELRRMYATVTRNLRKRKKNAGTWFLETTTMFAPGEESVAESTYEFAEKLAELNADGTRKYKRLRHRLVYDHRWGECEDLTAEEALRAAITEAFGEAVEWNDVEAILDEFYDPRKEVDDSRRFFLNARTSASDAWVNASAWAACADASKVVADGERITLGFDGSVRDDSTALVGCRVSDGHLFLLGCWEKPPGPAGDDWQVDREAVDAAVMAAVDRYEVVGMYADPAHWQDYLDRWQSAFGKRMRVKATQARPLEWWTNRPTLIVRAVERLHDAIVDRDEAKRLSHDADAVLTRHVLNARRRLAGKVGVTIGKEYAKSPRKIDAAMAAVLAYECRSDAVARGLHRPRRTRRAAGF